MACNVIRVQPWFEPMLYIVNSSPLVPHIYALMNWVSIGSGNGLSTIGLQPITWIPILICSLQWPHHGRDSVSNHQPHDCLLNHFFRRRSKKTSKLRVTGLCAGNSPVTGELPAQMASNAENVSIWWRHRVSIKPLGTNLTHISLDKMTVFSQTISSDTFSWMIFFY